MKNKVIIYALAACCILLTSCSGWARPEDEIDKVVFAHYAEDSLSQYVYADTTTDYPSWKSGFRDTVSSQVNKWYYPGTWGHPLISVDKIRNGDFLYKCNHGLYVGYPYNFGILTNIGSIYNIKWEDAANSNYNAATIIERQPLDYYIYIDIDKIKKYNFKKNITSGEQLQSIANTMMEDGSFFEAITFIGSQRSVWCFGKIEDYRQYVRDYRNGLAEYRFPIIDWLLE